MNDQNNSKLIDRLCDQFEKALRDNGAVPVVSDFLVQVDAGARAELLRELLLLESELLPADQWQPRLKQHLADFPEFGKILNEFLVPDPPIVEAKTQTDSVAINARRIGPYKILQTIGEGGMGSVYMAEQEHPVKRRVALKIIKAGLDSKQIIARFEAERQALAMMDHPSIARILDAGTTETGQPFFAMELVKGIPLTEYCDRHKLSIPDRLQIFEQICEGVQHAHQKGIIHRDLKPANILVAEYNGKPVPKIIDFGLAKALEVTNKLTDKTMFTEFGQVMGTLKYMSPEQAGLDSLDIDTRSDIYTLGIILYELLTGSTPLDGDSFKGQALLKILELVREQESPRPSSKLTTSKQTLSTVTELRQIDPRKLTQILSGDLDWIVMKAIDKDRARRYVSAGAFGEDIQRFLEDEVVEARPPSRSYKLRKFIKKNRGLVASLGVIATLLVAGVAGTSYGIFEALRAKNDAEFSAKRANEVLDVVTRSFASTQPDKGASVKMSALDVLKNMSAYLGTSDLDRMGKAQLLQTISEAMRQLGEFEEAIASAEEAADLVQGERESNPESWIAVSNVLGLAYGSSDRHGEALEVLEDAYDLSKNRLGEDHEATLHVANNLASAYGSAELYDKALPLFDETIAIKRSKYGDDHSETLDSILNLASLYQELARLPEAAKHLEIVLSTYQERFGKDNLRTATVAHNYAFLLRDMGELERSHEMYMIAAKTYSRHYDEQHPLLLSLLRDEAIVMFGQGDIEAAIERMVEVGAQFSQSPTAGGSSHAVTLGTHAVFLLETGDAKKAMVLFKQARPMYERNFGLETAEFQRFLGNMANCHSALKDFESAFEIYRVVYDRLEEKLGEGHPDTLMASQNLALEQLRRGALDAAMQRLERSLELARKQLRPNHPTLLHILGNIAPLYAQNRQFDKAIPLLREYQTVVSARHGPQHPDAVQALINLTNAELQSKQFDAALNDAQRLVDLTADVDGPAHEMNSVAQSMLGVAYSETGQHEEAIKILAKCLSKSEEEPMLKWVKPFFKRSCLATKNKALYQEVSGDKLPESKPPTKKD